jgi:hypothetical protein
MITHPSIRQRIYWGFAIASVMSMLLMLAAALLSFESLESTMLALDLSEERQFFLAHIDEHQRHDWQTASLTGVYIPSSLPIDNLPAIFQKRVLPFSGELHDGEQTFLVSMQQTANGQLYLAKNISLFERREDLFTAALLSAGLLLMGMSLLLAKFSVRSVIKPLQRLITLIEAAKPNRSLPLFPMDWRERELVQIASCLNAWMSALEQYMQRERQLLNMASHELRTPIAVIAGAVEVLQQRQSLNPADQQVLQRIQLASDEMRANIDILLALARNAADATDQPCTRIDDIIQQVVNDLRDSGLSTKRLVLQLQPITVAVNPYLLKMLLRNLLQNALQHTQQHPIHVHLQPHQLIITDQGPGLPPHHQQRLSQLDQGLSTQGLGLYVVTLIGERIGWKLEVDIKKGTTIKLQFNMH